MTYQNTQIWNECVLVSVWNAAKFYNIRTPKKGSKNYKKICSILDCTKELGCSEKNALSEIKRLGLTYKIGIWDKEWIKENIPVEIDLVLDNDFHSVLVVDYIKDDFLITNYHNDQKYVNWNWILRKRNNDGHSFSSLPKAYKRSKNKIKSIKEWYDEKSRTREEIFDKRVSLFY